MDTLQADVSSLSDRLRRETDRANEMWRLSCAQVAGFEDVLTTKEAEMEKLKARIQELEASR